MSVFSPYFFCILSHFYVGSMCLMRRLYLARSCASSPDNSLCDKSFLMLSNTSALVFLSFFSPYISHGPSTYQTSRRTLFIHSSHLLPAHCCRCGGRRPVPLEPGLVSRGLPNDAVHRVQRRSRNLPLLRQQVQLLADDDQLSRPVHDSGVSDAQGRQPAYGR